jgi:hypothetical protein
MTPEYIEVVADATTWRFDRAFLSSHWTCIWGQGCPGILAEAAPALGQGCCSVGAELDGEEEANLISALAATLEPEGFEYHLEAARGGVFADRTRSATRVVDGACIFLNRPGFSGGPGCALHLAAVELGDDPVGLKPSVCWQLPIKVEWTEDDGERETATVRAWTRDDWGPEGAEMAWWCTEAPEAHLGSEPVIDSLATEIEEIVGTPVYVELRRKWREESGPPT